jgi:uncharacterized protein (TIGR02996 family)
MPPLTAEELGLLQAIHERPLEDVHRLLYADWLEDHGQAEYAAFIRLQCSGPDHHHYAVRNGVRDALFPPRRRSGRINTPWELRKEYDHQDQLQRAIEAAEEALAGASSSERRPRRVLEMERADGWAGSPSPAPLPGCVLWYFSHGLPVVYAPEVLEEAAPLDALAAWLDENPRLRLAITWHVAASVAPLLEHRAFGRVNDLRLDDGRAEACAPDDATIQALAPSPRAAHRLERLVVDTFTKEKDQACAALGLRVCPFRLWLRLTDGHA